MTYNEIKRILQSAHDKFSELDSSVLHCSQKINDVCYLKISDNMLSSTFLQFLIISQFDFAVFPSYSDDYGFDIQIKFDV